VTNVEANPTQSSTAETPPRPRRNTLGPGIASLMAPKVPVVSQVARLGPLPARDEARERTKRNALASAMRAIPMQGDPETYRRRLNDFQLGYLAGHSRALRRALGPP
jgi:hypothetical protein